MVNPEGVKEISPGRGRPGCPVEMDRKPYKGEINPYVALTGLKGFFYR